MSAMTTTTVRTLQRRASGAARRRFLRTLLWAGVWFWALWAVLVLSLPLIVNRWGGVAEGLSYDTAGSPARWPAFAVGIIATGGLLATHLAAGGTRRALLDGVARGAVVGGAVFAVATIALTLFEQEVYASLDMPWQGVAGPLALDTVGGIALTVVAETLVITTYALVGVAVLGGYHRWGWLRGTLAIVPLLIPAALADVATRTGIFGLPLRGTYVASWLGVVGTIAGVLVAVALAALVAHRMLQEVRPRPS